MKKIVGVLTATAIALSASAAVAGATAAESSFKKVHAEWDKSHAQGGYGFPLTAIPMAIANTITGKPDRRPIAQSEAPKAKSN